jgi:hypothetical protein
VTVFLVSPHDSNAYIDKQDLDVPAECFLFQERAHTHTLKYVELINLSIIPDKVE